MKFPFLYFGLGFLLILGGCITPYDTEFDCPIPEGVPCTPLFKINQMIDQGTLGTPDLETEKHQHPLSPCNCKSQEAS